MKRDKLWKERKISQSDKALNVSTSVLFISKYSTCIEADGEVAAMFNQRAESSGPGPPGSNRSWTQIG